MTMTVTPQTAIFYCCLKLCCFFQVVLVLIMPATLNAALSPANIPQQREETCGDIDIRNSVENFAKLENCTVIEGFLRILLIDHGVPNDYADLSFPKLREITGFFLLYRVTGLRTLKNLFPNLAVIRGTKLLHNYAFVVYEMMSLQEVGLVSLTDILRGSVNIQKNPQLCYINTIDWDLIARNGRDGHFIKGNKESNQCPSECPPDLPCSHPVDKNRRVCWDRHSCQKVCDLTCGDSSCSRSGASCCHKNCLGGCSGPGAGNCSVCRRVVFQNRCMENCPTSTYEYAGRRCVKDAECRNMTTRPDRDSNNGVVPNGDNNNDNNNTTAVTLSTPWKLVDFKCLPECPPGYKEDEADKHSCIKCSGHCPKVCAGIHVDSVATAQKLRGCTKIRGALEIQISGGKNVVHELEENLSMIEEVEYYVKVVRSFPLVSLNFLKNLRKIHGKVKEKTYYSFIVLDNDNLLELMDFKNRKVPLSIESGNLLFHLNSKLCLSKIRELKEFAKLDDWDDRDVSPTSNGDKVACDIKPLNMWVPRLTDTAAILNWDNFLKNVSDHRSLLGYVIFHKEAPFRNVSVYDGRDACGTDSWKVNDHAASVNMSMEYESYILTRLTPFTQYAAFVRTYTVANENQGAQSNIIYFTTQPTKPSTPLDLKAVSPDHSQLHLAWLPPSRPNGNVTHYEILGFYEKDEQSLVDRRNYCQEPLVIPDRKKDKVFHENMTTNLWVMPTNRPEDCCECPKEKNKLKAEEEEVEFQIQFEDFLHNIVYVKRPSAQSTPLSDQDIVRRRRSITSSSSSSQSERSNSIGRATLTPSPTIGTTTSSVTSLSKSSSAESGESLGNGTTSTPIPVFSLVVNMSTKAVVMKLRHFSEYTVTIVACHDEVNKTKLCSEKAITTARTAALCGADNINGTSTRALVSNDTTGQVQLSWEEPPDPNGIIVSYHIEYRRTNVENYKPIQECITHKQYRDKRSYTLTELVPGNYSVRIRATSLAGDGDWTHPLYFFIQEPSGGLSAGEIAAIVACSIVLVVLLMCGGSYIFFKRKFSHNLPNGILYASVNPEYISHAYVPDEWEVPRSKITILEELGQGSFGMVYKGIAKDVVKGEPEVKVAVKTVNESADIRERIEFLKEASVMKAFACHHVVRLLGVVSKGQPTLVIMELMANGDLKSYLRAHRPEETTAGNPPTLKRILQMAVEIADGMSYLAAKKFVHRDLAARNCMVAEDLTVKVGDFGMTRDIYETDYYRKDGKGMLPVRWMAPESLKDGVFTSQSDVWSYGVVLWEMVTLASQPYQGMSNNQVLAFIVNGGIMDKPIGCPDKLYNLMVRCWERSPKMRPIFRELTQELLNDSSDQFRTVAFYFTPEAEKNCSSILVEVGGSGEGGGVYDNDGGECIEEEEEDDVSPSTPLKQCTDTDNISLSSSCISDNVVVDDNDDNHRHNHSDVEAGRTEDSGYGQVFDAGDPTDDYCLQLNQNGRADLCPSPPVVVRRFSPRPGGNGVNSTNGGSGVNNGSSVNGVNRLTVNHDHSKNELDRDVGVVSGGGKTNLAVTTNDDEVENVVSAPSTAVVNASANQAGKSHSLVNGGLMNGHVHFPAPTNSTQC